MKNVPPPPEGWNKTISDLMDEAKSGTRKTIGSPELDWARDYERNLLPPGTRFPCKGDIYEAVEDVEVSYLTSWASPYTGFYFSISTSALNKSFRLVSEGMA